MTTCKKSLSFRNWRTKFFGSSVFAAAMIFSGDCEWAYGQMPEPPKSGQQDLLNSVGGHFEPTSNSAFPLSRLPQSTANDGLVDRSTKATSGSHSANSVNSTDVTRSQAQLILPNSNSTASGGWSAPRPNPSSTATIQASYDQPTKAEFSTANFRTLPHTTADSKTASYQLEYSSMLRFEEALTKAYGQAVQVSTSTDGRHARWTLPSLSGKPMMMTVDRQSGLMRYEGDIQLQASWHRLMWQLDSKSTMRSDGSIARASVVFTDAAGHETVRQVANWQDQDDRIFLPGLPQDQQPTGKVTIIQDPNTGAIIVTAENEADRELVVKYIQSLNEAVAGRQRQTGTITLKYVQAATIETRVKELYDAAYQSTLGTIEIKSNPLNNTLIVVGFPDGLARVEEIVSRFDAPGDVETMENFRTFRLKFLSAVDAKVRLDAYYVQSQQALGAGTERLPSVPVVTIPDFRSNVIVVKGSRQSLQEAELLLAAIDVDKSDAENEVKVVKVRNRLAEELAVIVQDVINGQQFGAGNGFKGAQQQQQQFQQQQLQQGQQNNPNISSIGSKGLTMKPETGDGESVSSGILFDARVTADRDSNSIIISAPSRSIPLIELLIHELDRVPDVEVQMKVFHIVNGDARELLTTLQTLFGTSQQQGFGQQAFGQQGNLFNQLPLQTAGATPGSNLVNLRFSADPRTNTIIATGPVGELQVVEALLNRLDESRMNGLRSVVYRLSNAPALDIADAINNWIASRDDVNSTDPRAIGEMNQTDRRVIVVSEVVSNSLLIQAHPFYMDEVLEAIKAFDRRPPMVKVKVLLAEIDLSKFEEFGIDLGVQDSILFDRGTSIDAANAITGGIGFPFNSSAVGNQNAYARENLAGQGLSNLGTGRVNTEFGYGGLVLSAGNESINILLRAMQNKRCVRVLSKPHIMTMENLQGRVQVGANVPRIAGTVLQGLAVTQNIEFQNVGVILEVTPRVSPDGMIVLAVNASKSAVGPEATGITVGVGADGTPIRAPQILQTEAQTTLMARSGQTIVLAGLIQESKSHEERGIPILSKMPVVGPLFKYESDRASRSELLIILTPYLVTDDDDIDMQNQEEIDRIHWCLEDVAEIYGSTGHHIYQGNERAIQTIYPHENPTGVLLNNN
jgi:type II secretory pathway component GspD/PulD (secretin)